MATKTPWTIDVYETEKGEKPAWAFVRALEGRARSEAIAVVKLLEKQGNMLRRPHSGTLGKGLLELRGREVRIFYTFLPNRVIVLLDGMVKKQDAIPAKVLDRMRTYQKAVTQRAQGGRAK